MRLFCFGFFHGRVPGGVIPRGACGGGTGALPGPHTHGTPMPATALSPRSNASTGRLGAGAWADDPPLGLRSSVGQAVWGYRSGLGSVLG